MKFHLPLFLLILFAATGCTTVSTGRLASGAAEIQRGKTTRPEVTALLGEPDHKRLDPTGETWNYGGAHETSPEEAAVGQVIGIGAGFAPVPYLGTAISGVRTLGRSAQTSQPSAVIKFDKAGRVKDYVVDIP